MAKVLDRSRGAKSSVFGNEMPPGIKKFYKELVGNNTEKVDRARFINLSYKLLEWKIAYYRPDVIDDMLLRGLEIEDSQFDGFSEEYLALCIKYGWPNTICHTGRLAEYADGPGMFEVDFTRPVVHLILRKYGCKDWQKLVAFNRQDMHVNTCSHCGQATDIQVIEKPLEPKPKRKR